jgi:hypothetical protein
MDNTKNAQKSALPTPIVKGLLTRKEFQQLADVPPELEWFANIDRPLLERVWSRTTSTPALFLFKHHDSQPKSQSESNKQKVTSFVSFVAS